MKKAGRDSIPIRILPTEIPRFYEEKKNVSLPETRVLWKTFDRCQGSDYNRKDVMVYDVGIVAADGFCVQYHYILSHVMLS